MSDALERLQNWYSQQCNGEWEHGWGIKIETLDNPGWTMEIDLKNTTLENAQIQKTMTERSSQNWFVVWTEDSKFKAAGGANNLIEILEAFLHWARR
jgi:hypothetical protein